MNVWTDFTDNTPKFWEGFWDRGAGLGAGGADPDSKCIIARNYHQQLWSKKLPNGQIMKLESGRSRFYLRWNGIYFGSDSITASFRYYNNRKLLQQVAEKVGDYKSFVEYYLRKLYTIGGLMLFPSGPHMEGMNCARGCNAYIKDRWDLTLECIRMYYDDEGRDINPLRKVFYEAEHTPNKKFFDLFIDFKGFVDFFLLQDCVDENYRVVKWYDTPLFESNPIPKDVDSYLSFIQKELDFVERRNIRIEETFNNEG